MREQNRPRFSQIQMNLESKTFFVLFVYVDQLYSRYCQHVSLNILFVARSFICSRPNIMPQQNSFPLLVLPYFRLCFYQFTVLYCSISVLYCSDLLTPLRKFFFSFRFSLYLPSVFLPLVPFHVQLAFFVQLSYLRMMTYFFLPQPQVIYLTTSFHPLQLLLGQLCYFAVYLLQAILSCFLLRA